MEKNIKSSEGIKNWTKLEKQKPEIITRNKHAWTKKNEMKTNTLFS